jgi:acyl-CoA synthetase (AMP-forming)/AMP-acid ligase II
VPGCDAEQTEEVVPVGMSPDQEEVLRRFVLETLPAWQAPRHWWFVEKLRTSSCGKISRAGWRSRYLEIQPTGPKTINGSRFNSA